MQINESDIDQAKTDAGGWTKKQLAEWGVPWPPPKGWKRVLTENGTPYQENMRPERKNGERP